MFRKFSFHAIPIGLAHHVFFCFMYLFLLCFFCAYQPQQRRRTSPRVQRKARKHALGRTKGMNVKRDPKQDSREQEGWMFE